MANNAILIAEFFPAGRKYSISMIFTRDRANERGYITLSLYIGTNIMSLISSYRCTRCGKQIPYDFRERACPDCGSFLEIVYDLPAVSKRISKNLLKKRKGIN